MSSLGQRLRNLRESKKLNQKELAEILHINNSTLSQYESDTRVPSDEIKIKIAEYFDVTLDYLIGKPIAPQTPTKHVPKKGIKIPVLGEVQAGIPVEAIEDIIDYEEITEDMARTGEFFGLQVRGQSMEPRFVEGDVVIVRKQADVNSGDIAIVLVNGDVATIKKIKKQKNGITLMPLNPAFEPIFFNNEEISDLPVVILGKVVELRGKFY